MTTVNFPTRESPAGVMINDTAVNRRLHEFAVYFFASDQAEVASDIEFTSSRSGGIDTDGPGTTILIPCEVLTICIPRGQRC